MVRGWFGVLLVLSHFNCAFAVETTGGSWTRDKAKAPTTHAECGSFLEGAQAGLISSLEARIQENRQREIDFLAAVPRKQVEAEHFRDLEAFNEYRASAMASNISYNPTQGDFEQFRSLKNPIDATLSAPSPNEQEASWREFESFQAAYLGRWWQKESRRFPRWQSCLAEKYGELEFEYRPGRRHVLRPKARALPESASFSQRNFCNEVAASWARMSYAPTMLADYIKGEGAASTRRQRFAARFKDWMFYLRRDPGTLDDEGKRELIARAYGDLNKDLRKIHEWLKGLSGSDLNQLLTLEKIRQDLNGSSICEEAPSSTWSELAQQIGINFLVPGFDVAEDFLFKGPQNDRLFVAGFINRTSWESTNEELRRAAITSLGASAAGAEAWKTVLSKMAPVAQKALSRIKLPEATTPVAAPAGAVGGRLSRSMLFKKYDLTPRKNSGQPVVFGQKAVSPGFFNGGDQKGARLNDVVAKLKSGEMSPQDIPVKFIWVNGQKVTINNRSLTVLTKAGKKPVEIDMTGQLPETGPDSIEEVLLRLEEMNGQPSRSIGIRSGNTRDTPVGEIVSMP